MEGEDAEEQKSKLVKIGSLIAIVAVLLSLVLTAFVINKHIDSGKSSNFSQLWTLDEENEFLIPEVIPPGHTLELLYKGSRDGFNASAFHAKCDHKGPTLTVAKSKKYKRVFGGYTQVPWDTTGFWQEDEKAFLFSVTDRMIYPIKEGQEAVGHIEDKGPTFADFWFKGDNFTHKFTDGHNNQDGVGQSFGNDTGAKPGDLCCQGANSN